MSTESKVAILAITYNGLELAKRINSLLDKSIVFFKKPNVKLEDLNIIIAEGINTIDCSLKEFVGKIFLEYDKIIFIMSTGIVVRCISSYVDSKFTDPAILVIGENGKHVISLLSGHMGGANELAKKVGILIGADPIITTATDVNKKSALDVISKKLNAHIDDFRENVKYVNSCLVNKKTIGIYVDGNYKVDLRGFLKLKNFEEVSNFLEKNQETKVVVITNKKELKVDKKYFNRIIKLIPKDIVIGVGCRRNTDFEYMYDSLKIFLKENNIDEEAIAKLGSIELKKDEKAIIQLAQTLNIDFETFKAKEISRVDCFYEKSDFVKKNVGVYSVSEPVVHVMTNGNLIASKKKYRGITFAAGRINL